MAEARRARLKKAVAEFVARERVCRVATSGVAAMPHVVPVCHVLHGGRIYIGSGDTGRKVENIRENPQVTVVVDVYSDHWPTLRGVMVQGRARLIERGSRFRRIRDLLYAKYPQYRREAALSPSDSVIVEITPARVFSWGLD
ncbi:MAG: pyridoxamine 5'-phosphate oxidase family protein [Candidatus Rokuibacteriota bacterium]